MSEVGVVKIAKFNLGLEQVILCIVKLRFGMHCA